MAVTPDKVQIGSSNDFLDGVAVDTAAGTGLFRETVVLADPEAGGGLANIRQLSTQLVNTDKGVVTNTVIHGWTTAGGGSFVDIKANPSGALTVDATGSVVGLDATSIAALENINVTVTNTEVEIKNDAGNPIPVSGSVSVSNFPSAPSSGVNASVSGSTSQVTLLAANASRKGATIYNDSTLNSLKISLGGTVTATSFTAVIASTGYYEVPFGYTGIITGIFSAATGAARITEVV